MAVTGSSGCGKTTLGNVLLGLAAPDAGAVSRLPTAMRAAEELLDRRPGQVTGGELQRVALARALLVDPVFPFADEATARLDPLTQMQVMEPLREIAAECPLVLLVATHDLALAQGVARRVLSRGGAGEMPFISVGSR